MTTDRPTRRGVGPRRLQDDLLDDLRATVPVLALGGTVTASAIPAPAPRAPAQPAPAAPAPAAPAAEATPGTLAVELRLTPWRWSLPRMARARDDEGLLLRVGPLQVFVGRRAA